MIQYFAKELQKIAMAPPTTAPKVHTTADTNLSRSGASVKPGAAVTSAVNSNSGMLGGAATSPKGMQTKINPARTIKTVPSASPTMAGSLVR